MATDGDPRGDKPPQAEAKTEALTPERRAELMAAAEAQFRKDSRTGSRTASQPAVRVNTSRNKVEPLEPEVKTESGVHPGAGPSVSGLPAIPPPPDDRTEAISKAKLRQHLSSLPREPSASDRPREAGFDETVASPSDPALEPTLPPQLDNVEQARGFESEATIAYMPDALPSGPPKAAEPAVDRTANDLPMPTLTAPPAPPVSGEGDDASAQPEWLGNARPVDLQRPPSGAPSEFGDVATGVGPAPLPSDDEAAPPSVNAAEETVDGDAAIATSAPANKRSGCSSAFLIVTLFSLVGLAAGGAVAAMLWGPELLVALGLDDEPTPSGGEGDTPADGPPPADDTTGGQGPGAVTGNRAIEPPPPDAVTQTALRLAVVDDLSESGYELAAPFGDTVTWRLRALGPFQIVDGDPITEGANLSLFLKKVAVHETDDAQVATAWCGASLQVLGEGAPAEPTQLKATAKESGPLPDVGDDVEDDAYEQALHPHRYRIGGAAALGCAKTLAELVASELKVDGPPSAPDAPAVALPETVPPLKVAVDEPAPEVKKAKKKRRKKTRRKKKRRKKKKRKRRR